MSKRAIPIAKLLASDLPAPVRVFWERAPENFKIPCMLTVLCCYCALSTRLRVKYAYDADLHALLLQIVIVGQPGDGKSFTRPLVYKLMRPVMEQDEVSRRQEQAYNDLLRTHPKKIPPEPLTNVRFVQKITHKKLIKRADMFKRLYGEPMTFFFYCEELAGIAEGYRQAYSDLRVCGRLAYDLGALDSNDTMSETSYNAVVDIIWCSLYCSTPAALDKYMDRASIEGGSVTRHVVADLGDLMGMAPPTFQPLTAEQDQLVEETIQQLMDETYTKEGLLQPTHQVDMDWLFKEVNTWCEAQRKQVLRTDSNALNCFYKRASVSAFRLATMCYHLWGEANGGTEAKQAVSRFYRFMAQYILDGLMSRWGASYEKLQQKRKEPAEEPPVTIYGSLSDRFTRDELRARLAMLGRKTDARVFLSKWKSAHLIRSVKGTQDTYEKMN